MNKRKLLLLLQVIQNNGNIRKLLHEKISYKEIAELTTEAVENGYLEYFSEKIVLTSSGKDFLSAGTPELTKKSKEDWIQPDLKSKIRQIDRNDIFLPRENDLSF